MTHVIQIKGSIDEQLEIPKIGFLLGGQNANISYKIQQFNKLYSGLTGESKNLYNTLSERILNNVNIELLDKFQTMKLKIANRKLYVLYEDLLGCNPKSDHLEPKNILPLFAEYLDEAEENLRKSLFYVCMTSFQDFILDTLLNETDSHQQTQQKLSSERLQNAMSSLDHQELQRQLDKEVQKLAALKQGIAMQRVEAVEQDFQLKTKAIYEPDFGFRKKNKGELGLDDFLLQFLEAGKNQQNQLENGFSNLNEQISELTAQIRELIAETSLDQLLRAKREHYNDIKAFSKLLTYQQRQLDKLEGGDYDELLRKFKALQKKYDDDMAEKNAKLKTQQELLQRLQLGSGNGFRSYEDYLAAGMRDNEKASQAGQFGVVDNNLDFLSMDQLSKMSRDQLIAYASKLQKDLKELNKAMARLQQQCNMFASKMSGMFLVNHFYKNQLYDLLRKINHEFGQSGQLALPLTKFFNAKNVFMKEILQSSITDGTGIVNDQLNDLLIDNMDLGTLQSRREDDSRIIGSDEQLSNILKCVSKDVVRQDAENLLPKAGKYYGDEYLNELAEILHSMAGNSVRGYGDRLKKLTQLRDEAITLGKLDKGIQVNAYDVLTEFSEAGLTYQDIMSRARAKARDDVNEYAKQLRSVEQSILTSSQLRTPNGRNLSLSGSINVEKQSDSYLKQSDLETNKGNKLQKLLEAAEKLSEEARIIAGNKYYKNDSQILTETQRRLNILNRAYDTPTMTVTYFEDDLLAEIKTICVQFFDNLEGAPQIIIDNELLRQREQLSKSVDGKASGRPAVRPRGEIKSQLGPRYGSDCYKITSGRPGSSQSILQPRNKGGLMVNVTKMNIEFQK